MTLKGTLVSGGVTSSNQITFTIRYIDRTKSYLSTPAISDIDYTVKDPQYLITLPPFINSDSSLSVIYALVNYDGSPINSNVFTFNPVTRFLGIYTTLNSYAYGY